MTDRLFALKTRLRRALGPGGFDDGDDICRLMGQDIWSRREPAAFVIAPASLDELAQAVRLAHEAGVPLNARGGGMSYTNGYTPDRPGMGVIDFSRMDGIIALNEEDMYVTVQAGVTWKTLFDALEPHGLRTPFWGPLSGLTSTIGGGLSQNNAFFGAGSHGSAAHSVLSVSVVLGDGTIVRTGSAATGGTPFFRDFGPDLTGLFLGDAGALGHKAEITLRLIERPAIERHLSFEFASRESCAAALHEAGKTELAAELFGFDPGLTAVRMQRASLSEDIGTLSKVVAKEGSLLRGLAEGAKLAAGGRHFLKDGKWSLHMTVEGRSQAGVAADADRLIGIMTRQGGEEVAGSVPKVIRANPFAPLNSMLGPAGERWVPVHGIVPMSKGAEVWAKIDALFGDMHEEFIAQGIKTGFLVTTLGAQGFLIEPVFLWPEERLEIHEASLERAYLDKLPRHAPAPSATALVARARSAVIDIFTDAGAAHFQIGRTYPYKERLEPGAAALLEAIKRAADDKGVVNPGSLGLLPAPQPIPMRDPRTGERTGHVTPLGPDGLDAIFNTQDTAANDWQARGIEERGAALLRLAGSLEDHKGAIAAALEKDTGRRRIAMMEVEGAIQSIRGWTATAPSLLSEEWVRGRQNPEIRHRAQFVPYRHVGVISPWNFPLTLSVIDAVPALLAGATVVVKPSEVTSRFVGPVEAAVEAAGLGDVLGFAKGGAETGAQLIERVECICFTGSVATGRKVAIAAATAMIPAFLELGGKDPLIVLPSADIDLAADAALRGSVLASGQACQSIERIYVHEAIADAFLSALTEKAKGAALNWPDIGKGEIGPIIFDRQADILASHLADASAKGAELLTGGAIERHGGGAWLRPTVLSGVTHEMAIMREESFGPVMPVMIFSDADDPAALANDSPYGLSAAVFAGTIEEAERLAMRIDAGAVSLNDAALTASFYEAEKTSFKLSGLGGSRMGASGFTRFLRKKALIANEGRPAPLGAFAEDA